MDILGVDEKEEWVDSEGWNNEGRFDLREKWSCLAFSKIFIQVFYHSNNLCANLREKKRFSV